MCWMKLLGIFYKLYYQRGNSVKSDKKTNGCESSKWFLENNENNSKSQMRARSDEILILSMRQGKKCSLENLYKEGVGL